MKKRSILLLVVATMWVAVLAIPAAAGEVKGPPGPDGATGGATPVAGFWSGDGAASICSFSGLNDEINDDEPTQTQSYGTFLVLIKKFLGVSTAEAKAILGEGPADSCNPNHGPNPKGVGK